MAMVPVQPCHVFKPGAGLINWSIKRIMELPTIPEQLIEADRLCAERRRLIEELRLLVEAARARWQKSKGHRLARRDSAAAGPPTAREKPVLLAPRDEGAR